MIAATILAGTNSDLLEDAVRSVSREVDRVLLYTHTPGLAETLGHYAWTCRERPHPGTESDSCADWRNHCLKDAALLGYEWALILDTDERLICQRSVKNIVAWTTANVLAFSDTTETYNKAKLFRLPTKGKWVGPCHEYWDWSVSGRDFCPDAQFVELRKTQEQEQAKAEAVIACLTKQVPIEPIARWYYYLGDAYQILQRWEKAKGFFQRAINQPGSPEERAWSCFRAAAIHAEYSGNYEKAIDLCVEGLRIFPLPEHAWYAGWCALQQKRYQCAIVWAEIAKTIYRASPNQRIGFRLPKAWTFGPDEVISEAKTRLSGKSVPESEIGTGLLK